MMKTIFYILILIGLVSCSEENQNLEENSTITAIFNTTEIEDLNTILSFFESEICINEDASFENCYQSFFSRTLLNDDAGTMEFGINFENQLEIYSQLNPLSFNEIWAFNKMWFTGNRTDTLKSISYSRAKYTQFLQELGKEDRFIERYYNSYNASGDIGPSEVAAFIINYKYLNIKDVRIRLVIALHYLTLNDQYTRVEKY